MTDARALATVHRVTHYIIRSNLALDLLTKYQNSKYKNDLSENILQFHHGYYPLFLP